MSNIWREDDDIKDAQIFSEEIDHDVCVIWFQVIDIINKCCFLWFQSNGDDAFVISTC